jgi:hypothetical protein
MPEGLDSWLHEGLKPDGLNRRLAPWRLIRRLKDKDLIHRLAH